MTTVRDPDPPSPPAFARLAALLAALDGTPTITCPRCGLMSHHPVDVAERYCGNCHRWHADMGEP